MLAQGALVLVAAATLSRSLIGVLAVLVVQWAAQRGTWRLAAAYLVAAVAVLAVLTVGRLHIDPTRPLDTSYRVPDPGNRREAAATSWQTLRAHPVLGKGPGTYPGRNRGEPFRAHLTPLNVAATVGIPALAALVGMFLVLWRDRPRPTQVALWSGVVGLALDGLAQDTDHFRHVWLLVGLLMVGTQARRAARDTSLSVTRPNSG
jgi:O-antigen ligase